MQSSRYLITLAMFLVPLVPLIGIFSLTAATDETWILLGVRGLVEHGVYGLGSPFSSVFSTGGMFTLLAAILYKLGGGDLNVIRLVAFFSLCSLFFLLFLLGSRLKFSRVERFFLYLSPLLVPSTLTFGGLAYGTVLSFIFLLSGALCWAKTERFLSPWFWLSAILLGSAAAVRLESLPVLIAPLFAVVVFDRSRKSVVLASCVGAVGTAVWGLQYALHQHLSTNIVSMSQQSLLSLDFLQDKWFVIASRLNFFSIQQSYFPWLFAAMIGIGWNHIRKDVAFRSALDVLFVFGIVGLIVWLVQAPIPHLRYLWPSLMGLCIVFSVTLVHLMRRLLDSSVYLLICSIIVLATGSLDFARSLLHGESDILSWEQSREAPYNLKHGVLVQRKYQNALVARLQSIPSTEPVATIGFATALTYLSKKEVLPVEGFYGPAKESGLLFKRPGSSATPPKWLVIVPFATRYKDSIVGPELSQWLLANCYLRESYGPYALYEIRGNLPVSSKIFDDSFARHTFPTH